MAGLLAALEGGDRRSVGRVDEVVAKALAERDAALRARVLAILEGLVTTGSPAPRSRGEKLLVRLRKIENGAP